MASNDFNLDKSEYHSVFKVFDKDNSGEINIGQVYELINKFEDSSRQLDGMSISDPSQGGGSTIQNGSNSLSKATTKGSTTTTTGSKSPTKKAGTQLGQGVLQLKPTQIEGNNKSPRLNNAQMT